LRDTDPFICWTRRSDNPTHGSDRDQKAILKPVRTSSGSGEIRFLKSGADVKVDEAVTQMELTLSQDGSWKEFWVVGTGASTEGKDVIVRAEVTGGNLVGEFPLMVRVRKDANKLTLVERDKFLVALLKLKQKPELFDNL